MIDDLFVLKSPSGLTRERGTRKLCGSVSGVTLNTILSGIPAWSTDLKTTSANLTCKYFADQKSDYGNGIWPFRPCVSVKAKYNVNALPVGDYLSDYVQQCTGALAFSRMSEEAYFNVPSDGLELRQEQYVRNIPIDAKVRLLNRVEAKLPTLEPDIQLFVFVYELLEMLPGLIKGLWELAKILAREDAQELSINSLKGIVNYIRNALKERGILDATYREVAQRHIEWSFVVRPLITETQQLWSAIFDWHKRVDKLIKGEGAVHDLTTSIEYEVEPDWPRYTWYNSFTYTVGVPNFIFEMEGVIRQKLSMTLKYRYAFPRGFCKLETEIGQHLAATGMMPTTEQLWELVPFSFVLDWVFNTSRLIGRIDKNTGWDVQTTIVDACLCLKEHEISRSRVDHYFVEGVADDLDKEVFIRWVGEEAFDQLSWWFKPPSFMAVLLGASLVGVLTK